MRVPLLLTLVGLAGSAGGCGDDSDADLDGGLDASVGDAGTTGDAGPDPDGGPPLDGAIPDAGPIETVTLDGTIFGEETMGPGTAPRLADARVSILWLDGTVFDTTTTAADGTYTLTTPRRMTMMHRVEPMPGYLGGLRGERPHSTDYAADPVRLAERAGVVDVVMRSGSTYDPSLGYLVAGFNPVSYMDGGESVALAGVTHDPSFTLYPGGVMLASALPRICGVGETPADGCAPDGRLNQLFFPNLGGTTVHVTVGDPAVGSCMERFGIADWPVYADTVIKINVDCM